MAVAALESRVLLDSSALPSDIDQIIQNSSCPAAFYAALDVLLPAYENYAVDRQLAYDTYNSSISNIKMDYEVRFSDLTWLRQSTLNSANNTYWATAAVAENGLTTAFLGAKAAHQDTVYQAYFSDYWSAVQDLYDEFYAQMAILQESGSGSGGGAGGLVLLSCISRMPGSACSRHAGS